MNKVIRLGMVFDEDDVPDFGSIVEDVHQMGLYYLLARDIPKLNTMLTRAAAENYLIDNEAFAFFSGYMAYVIDHKEAGTGEIYAYHRGKDRWYEFNIRLDKNFNEIIWERHKRILRETKTISGTAPLTFICNKSGTLKNYRIYGNTITVSGESKSVGDKTINLFDKTKTNRQYNIARNADGSFNYNPSSSNYFDYYISVKANTNYIAKGTNSVLPSRMYFFDAEKNWIGRTDIFQPANSNGIISFTTPSSCGFVQVQEDRSREIDINGFMIVEGTSVPGSYVPYGYCIPVTIGNQTTDIILTEPLKRNGDNADYIDYAKQKRFNIDGTNDNITLPAIPVLSGTKTISIDTAIQPSMIQLRGKIKISE